MGEEKQILGPIVELFLAEFNRLLELSRTSGLFPGLSSPGKCHNKIPGLSRFSCISHLFDCWSLRLLFLVVFLVFYCCDGFKFFQYCKVQWVVNNSEWSISSYDEESTHQWEDRTQPRDIMIKEPDFTLVYTALSTLRRGNLITHKTPVILDLNLEKTRSGKSHVRD